MKKVIKIIAIVLACFLGATLVAAVIGRGVTGKWNPVEWGNSTGITQPKDGVDGKDGIDGKDGETPYIGENGNWFIGEVDTGVKAEGKDGVDGADGQDGKPGTKLYRHLMSADNVGISRFPIVFELTSSVSTSYTLETLPEFTATVRTSYSDCSFIPVVVYKDNSGLKIKIYNEGGSGRLTDYDIESFTDIVEAV